MEATFRLLDRASAQLRDIRREAERTDRALLRAGASADLMGGQRAMQSYSNAERGLQRVNREVQKGSALSGVFANRWVMIGGAVLSAAPLLVRLSGSVVQLVGSLVQAVGGAGVIGGGALGAFVVGLGSVLLVVKDVQKDLKASQTAFANYNKVVAEYGARSTQAARAQSQLNYALKSAPAGTLALLQNVKALGVEWDKATRSARGYVVQTANYAIARVRSVLPQVGGLVNRNVGAVAGASRGMIDRLLDPANLSILERVSAGFRRDLPPAADAATNLALSFGRLVADAQPFVRQFIQQFDRWTIRLDVATRDTQFMHYEMQGLVTEFRHWMTFLESTWHLLMALFKAATLTHSSLSGITGEFNKWTSWLNTHPVRVARFFEQSKQGAHDLGAALMFILRLFGMLATHLDPLWQALRQIIGGFAGPLLSLLTALARTFSILGQGLGGLGGPLGLMLRTATLFLSDVNTLLTRIPFLGTLLAGALAVVGIVRMTNAMGGFISRLGGAESGMVALTAQTNAAAAATERLAGASAAVGGVPAFLGRGMVGGVVRPGVRSAFGPVEGAITESSAFAMQTPMMGFGLSGGATRGGRFGFPGLAARVGGLSTRVGALGGRALAGLTSPVAIAGLLAGPVAGSLGAGRTATRYASDIGMGAALGATVGSVVPILGTALGAGLGALGGGVLAAFTGGGDTSAIQQRHMTGFNQRVISGYMTSPRGGRIPIYTGQTIHHAGLQEQIARLGGTNPRTPSQISGQIRAYQAALAGGFIPAAQRGAVAQQVATLQSVLPSVTANARHAAFTGAFNFESQLGGGFNVISGAQGPVAGMEFVRRQALARWARLGPDGKRVLAQGLLSWAQQMQQSNPALAGQFEALKNSIIGKFVTMNGAIHIVHGQILTGTQREWQRIADAMKNPVEQARESISANLTLIQQKAVGSLEAMGFTSTQARNLVQSLEAGGSSGALAASVAAGRTGYGALTGAQQGGAQSAHRHRARGGRIPGIGLQDTVPLGGAMVAPGELVVNRHTEARVNQMLGMHGMSLGGMVARENLPHSFATGGRLTMASLLSGSTTLPGVPGALIDTTGLEVGAATLSRLNSILGGGTRGTSTRAAQSRSLAGLSGGTSGANQALAYQMMLGMGWGADQWPALKALWMGESGFNDQALNASSGAFGIPQSLPASKMASAGADWQTNPATQIRWGLNYISGRYGSPSAAYSTWSSRSPHWYGDGGRFVTKRPQLIGVGDKGAEEVTIRPLRNRGRVGGGGGMPSVTVHIGSITYDGPGSIRDVVRGEIRDAIADVASELDRTGFVPDEELLA